MHCVHKKLTIWIQVTKVAGKMLQKGCHGQTSERQAGTSKSKLINTKLLVPSVT